MVGKVIRELGLLINCTKRVIIGFVHMYSKSERLNKIKVFLRMQSSAASVTEVHEALVKRMNLKISRKTVERDLVELEESEVVSMKSQYPSRYWLNKLSEVELKLNVEDVNSIIAVLEPDSDLYVKLKKFVN
jgi:hypothetical protein